MSIITKQYLWGDNIGPDLNSGTQCINISPIADNQPFDCTTLSGSPILKWQCRHNTMADTMMNIPNDDTKIKKFTKVPNVV